MAGVNAGLTTRAQVAAIAGLRWRLFRNSLGTWKARLELAAFVIAGSFTALLALGGAIACFALGFLSASGKLVAYWSTPFWAIFLAWQFLPLMLGALRAEFDFRHLLRFPLRYSTFLLLTLVYCFFDVAALISLAWCTGLGLGMLAARPSLLTWVLLALTLFAAACFLLNRVIYIWLERLLATRRSREILFVVFLILVTSLQFIGPLLERHASTLKPLWLAIAPVLNIFPPSAAANLLSAASQGNFPAVLAPLLLLLLTSALLFHLLHRRTRALYLGEDLGESDAPRSAAAAPVVAPPRTLFASLAAPFPDPLAALLEKEFLYFFRNSVLVLNLFLGPLFVLFFLYLSADGSNSPLPFLRHSPLGYSAAVAYTLMILPPLGFNGFAHEGRGIQFLLSAPLDFRPVFLAKNLLLTLLIALEGGVLWLMFALLVAPPSLAVTATTLLAAGFVLLVIFSVGNPISVMFPRAYQFGSFRQRQSGVTVVTILVTQLFVFVLGWLIFFLARRAGSLWYAAATFAVFCTALVPLYRFLLARSAALCGARRETLLAELCKD